MDTSDKPLVVAHVSTDVSADSIIDCFTEHVMPVARPTWKREKIKTTTKGLDGGYSNHIVGITQDGAEGDVILMRIYSDVHSLFFDRDVEIKVMHLLYKAGMNPPVYCKFSNAICYGYAPGRQLTLDDLKNEKVLESIAITMAQYHSIDCKDLRGLSWIDKVSSLLPQAVPDDEITRAINDIIGSKEALEQELADVKRLLEGFCYPKVLCHNDVHVLNMIYDEENGKVTFIDQEAAGYEHLSCEIGNFFRYFVGVFEGLDSSRYPTEAEQKRFIRMYLMEKACLEGASPDTVTDEEIHSLYLESRKGDVVNTLIEILVLFIIIDRSRANGLSKMAQQIEFLRTQFEHYKLRKRALKQIV